MPASKYEADSGDIHRIRLSADRLAVAGAPPAGAVSSNIQAKVSKTNREFGLRPRGVRLADARPLVGGGEAIRYTFLPVLTPAAFATAAFALGATVTYDGDDWEVVARLPEDF